MIEFGLSGLLSYYIVEPKILLGLSVPILSSSLLLKQLAGIFVADSENTRISSRGLHIVEGPQPQCYFYTFA